MKIHIKPYKQALENLNEDETSAFFLMNFQPGSGLYE